MLCRRTAAWKAPVGSGIRLQWGGGRGVRFLQQYSQPGCRFLKWLSDLPRLELCETGTVKGDEAGPLGLTPSDMPGPFMCVFALTRPFLIHSLPPSAHRCARAHTHTHTHTHTHSLLWQPPVIRQRSSSLVTAVRLSVDSSSCAPPPPDPSSVVCGPALDSFACLSSHCL